MQQHNLKMNEEKTEFLIISSKRTVNQLCQKKIRINNHDIITSQVVRNIGVQFDATLSMTSQVSSICKKSHIYIKNILKMKKLLDKSSLEQIVHAFITSRIDNCNSLLCGVPTSEIHRLQKIQNSAARIITVPPELII